MTGWDWILAFITCIGCVVGAVQISYNMGYRDGRQFECARRTYGCVCCRSKQ